MMLSVPRGAVLTPQDGMPLPGRTLDYSWGFRFADGKAHSTITGVRLGQLDVICYQGAGLQQCERTRQDIQADQADFLNIFLPEESMFGIRHEGVEADAPPESYALLSTAKPFRAYIRERSEGAEFSALCIQIPASLLRIRMASVDELSGRFLAVRGISQVMREICRISLTNTVLSDEERMTLGSTLLDVLSTSLDRSATIRLSTETLRSVPEQTLERAKTFIDTNLSRTDLGPRHVAQHCRISTRHLQSIFLATSYSVARYIKERRLQYCRAAIRDPALAHRSIISIAEQWGFDDSSSFSRMYAARFGTPPSVDRARFSAESAVERLV